MQTYELSFTCFWPGFVASNDISALVNSYTYTNMNVEQGREGSGRSGRRTCLGDTLLYLVPTITPFPICPQPSYEGHPSLEVQGTLKQPSSRSTFSSLGDNYYAADPGR